PSTDPFANRSGSKKYPPGISPAHTNTNPSTNFFEELKLATTRRKQSLEISNGRSDDEDHSPESNRSANSRPTTPVANQLQEVGVNNLVYQINRDTLVNETL
ncbi:unnamed protein product, partial [Rotaria sp. Silwood1]